MLVAPDLLPPFFSNLRNLGTEGDATKEHEINSIDICSTYWFDIMLFCRISSCFQVREVWNIWEGAILLPLIVRGKLCVCQGEWRDTSLVTWSRAREILIFNTLSYVRKRTQPFLLDLCFGAGVTVTLVAVGLVEGGSCDWLAVHVGGGISSAANRTATSAPSEGFPNFYS